MSRTGYARIVGNSPLKVHVVTYVCDQCGAKQSCKVGAHSHGMCSACGALMKIEDLFSDRRIVALPVTRERRDDARGHAA